MAVIECFHTNNYQNYKYSDILARLLYGINLKQIKMSVLKVIEILGNSTASFEDAVQNVINEAAKSVKNIKSVYIVDMQVTVNNNKIKEYRVNTKVTFGIIDN